MNVVSNTPGLAVITAGAEVFIPLADIAALPRHAVFRPSSECGNSTTHGQRFEGALLADVLDRLVGLSAVAPEIKRCGVAVVLGADGYRCVLSLGEIFNSSARILSLVALCCDGEPLPETSGPIALLMADDVNAGPRFVKRLTTVELISL